MSSILPAPTTVLSRHGSTKDKKHFHQLYQEHSGSVFATALAVLRQPQDAEDVTQDVFRTLWRKGDMFEPTKGKFTTWLGALARNRAIDYLRSRQRRSRIIDTYEELPPPSPDMVNHATGYTETASLEEHEMVRRAMVRLPEAQRQALEMAYFEGKTHAEVAEKLGEPLGTIKARIRRGLIRLKELLRDDLNRAHA
jgi:RNA polymerase sigma-70 factor (ECF subfamily)